MFTPAVSTSQSRRPQSRSVWGCLTCRRRKVKCRSRTAPCDTCQRLGVTCLPSFHSNFKEWKQDRSTRSGGQPVTIGFGPEMESPRYNTSTSDSRSPECGTDGPRSGSPGGCGAPREEPANASQEKRSDPVDQTSWDSVAALFLNNSFESTSPDADRREEFENFQVGQSEHAPETDGWRTIDASTCSDQSIFELGFVGPTEHSFFLGFDNLEAMPGTSPTAPFPPDIGVQSPIGSLNPPLDEDRALVKYYKEHLSLFFSVKSSQSACWNFYTYAIQSSEVQTDSPLRHGILSWTSSHLMLKDRGPSEATRHRHYARAKSAVDDLLAEVSMGPHSPGLVDSISRKLSMIISTSLFLCYADVVAGDHAALMGTLAGVKTLLVSQWDWIRERLGPLECRILVWLAYLDLRSNLWLSATPNRSNPTSLNYRHRRGELSNFLTTQRGFSSLRSGDGARYYLSECFGWSYPDKELKEDLLQEPAKFMADDAMTIFSNILEFEAWDDGVGSKSSDHDALIQELRCAKVQALRADIARARAECKVIHAELIKSSTGPDLVARTDFHCSITTALHLAATILLNRIVSPDVRTDDEAQAAAREIVHITRRLRRLGFLCPPRSLVWPIPIFVAGIEVADEIYQDWVLDHMREMAGWGTSTTRAGELLAAVIDKQAVEGKRVRVRDVMEGLACTSHVLV